MLAFPASAKSGIIGMDSHWIRGTAYQIKLEKIGYTIRRPTRNILAALGIQTPEKKWLPEVNFLRGIKKVSFVHSLLLFVEDAEADNILL